MHDQSTTHLKSWNSIEELFESSIQHVSCIVNIIIYVPLTKSSRWGGGADYKVFLDDGAKF